MSALPWFRMYTEAIDDEKLRLLAFEDRWHFVALLCCKGQGILDDQSPLMMRKVAVKLGLDLRTLEDVARRLAEVELIDQKTLQPLAWDSRQHQSDSSKERTRAYRERMKRHGDVTVTPQETDTDTDVEGETDKEKEGGAASSNGLGQKVESTAKPPATQSATKATRLPADWVLPADWGNWAMQERPDMSREAIRKVADSFRDHWLAAGGASARKVDWFATWRNWVRREKTGGPAAMTATNARPSFAQQRAQAEIDAFVNGDADNNVIEGEFRRVGF